MTGRQLSAALRAGKRVYGTLIVSTSPRWVEAVQPLGLDFVFLDTEHVPIDRATLAWMCQAYRAAGMAPLVRIPRPDPYLACMAADGGACGIIAPYVESAEEVRALRGAVKLRPLKGRLLRALLEADAHPQGELGRYLAERNADGVLVVNVESVPAVEALEAILAVPQLDGVLIGPHDLSISMGIPEQYAHPEFDRTVRQFVAAARARGVGAGIHYSMGIQPQIAWARAGANLIVHDGDITSFARSAGADLAALRAALGDAPAGAAAGPIV